MSEPVIKAMGYQCPTCRHMAYENMRGGPWMHCALCNVDTTALYGPDDLVRVALATFEWAGFKVDPEGAEGKAAAVIVDRLTKGET